MNWISKAADAIAVMSRIKIYEKNILAFKNQIAVEILSHAPVIDAEKIALKIKQAGHITGFEVENVTQLISDSIDLNIEWVDGRASWGIFKLVIIGSKDSPYHYQILFGGSNIFFVDDPHPTQELAQQAATTKLKKILTGVKE